MARYIDSVAMKKMVTEKHYEALSKSYTVKSATPIKGSEKAGVIVYRRKAQYDSPFENRA